jgi:DNA-directed RNA polymerase specialized sigma24 family protein
MASVKTPKNKPTIQHNNKTIYLNNKELMDAVIESFEQDKMTDKLAKMLMLLCERYASRSNFSGYTYILDMQAYALLSLCKTWRGFDPNKGSNPFAYYTQSIYHSFLQYLSNEKKHRQIRDKLIMEQGLNPSQAFCDEMADDLHIVEDEQDFSYVTHTAKQLQQNQRVEDKAIDRCDLGWEIESDPEVDEPSETVEITED